MKTFAPMCDLNIYSYILFHVGPIKFPNLILKGRRGVLGSESDSLSVNDRQL